MNNFQNLLIINEVIVFETIKAFLDAFKLLVPVLTIATEKCFLALYINKHNLAKQFDKFSASERDTELIDLGQNTVEMDVPV